MYSEAIEALLAMGEYLGALNAFLRESTATIEGALKCSPEEAERILQELTLLHDRDAKFCTEFDDVLRSDGLHCLTLPPRSPNLNAFAERWVRSVKEECLSKLVLFGEGSLHRALNEFIVHFHSERNHQGKRNVLLFPCPTRTTTRRKIHCRERLGGLLRYYSCAA
jgi:hypothetical protein